MEEMSRGAEVVEVDVVFILVVVDEEEAVCEVDEAVVAGGGTGCVVGVVKLGSTFMMSIFSSLPALSEALTERMYCPG